MYGFTQVQRYTFVMNDLNRMIHSMGFNNIDLDYVACGDLEHVHLIRTDSEIKTAIDIAGRSMPEVVILVMWQLSKEGEKRKCSG